MGWIVATAVLTLLLVGTVWFAGYVIVNMHMRQQGFEDELEERIDSALRVLDESFMKIALVANKPVFFDSPEVRAVVSAIQRSRDGVVYVAELLSDVTVEDKSEHVALADVEYVTKDDPHDPKDAATLDRESRRELAKDMLRRGDVDVLAPAPSTHDGQPTRQQPSSIRAAAALARHVDRMKAHSSPRTGGTS